MESKLYESAIKGLDACILFYTDEMRKKQLAYEKSKRDLYSIIEDKNKYIDMHKKMACKECYGCDFCDNKDEMHPNWECSKGHKLGAKCEDYYELPF